MDWKEFDCSTKRTFILRSNVPKLDKSCLVLLMNKI
jgi:hypothetical protein